ncbi:riboflavin-specific deaminase/GTP cyclohydrolase II [Capsaspora owczarzaki ATCC 30864]|nr:riboflavin-specific deaminase/GTP cyclohydrolase II [Capsaspora owczarzaki ATCC 30864]KJE96139.1 hypothetical protein, variant [Capsaspora owczarzaki ATCC 30864]|eukprot:XP_004345253.1 riboflavin-specific deaminase/GTP cyclohydrolase II [Capsaspora owczarzaki ATCC 30864]
MPPALAIPATTALPTATAPDHVKEHSAHQAHDNHDHDHHLVDSLLASANVTKHNSTPSTASTNSSSLPEKLVREVQTRIPTDFGSFQLALYSSNKDNKEHCAMIYGDVSTSLTNANGELEPVPVRVHSECFTGEVMGSRRCDCAEQLRKGLQYIANQGRGVVVFLRQEGRGIGLRNKLRAYNLQDQGYDTVDANLLLGRGADERDFTVAALILQDLGISHVRLLTNNPVKIEALVSHGITVHQRVGMAPEFVSGDNRDYFVTKNRRLRHLIDIVDHKGASTSSDTTTNTAMATPEEQASPVNGGSPERPLSPLQVSASSPAVVTTTTTTTADASTVSGGNLHNSTSESHGTKHTQDFLAGAKLQRMLRDQAERPYVVLSYAQSLDGCIAAEKGKPLAISGEASLVMTHRLRAEHAGILVGINTVLADNPSLTVRLVSGNNPQPIVLDTHLRFPLTAKLLTATPLKPWIITSLTADASREQRLVELGARVIRVPIDPATNSVSLVEALHALYRIGLPSVMVEGGASVIRSFLNHPSHLIDRLVVTIAPVILAGTHSTLDGKPQQPVALPQLRNVKYEQFGRDVVLSAEPYWASS